MNFMLNKEQIQELSTHRLLNIYRQYRYSNYGEYRDFADMCKEELDKREHVVTKGRKHESRKKKK